MGKGFSTMVELLRWRVARHSNKAASIFLAQGESEAARSSYSELDRQARCIAAALQNSLPAGARALLVYPSSLDYITAFLGCLYAGIIAVPIYSPGPKRLMPRLQAISTDAQASAVLGTVEVLADLETSLSSAQALNNLLRLSTDDLPISLAETWKEPAITGDTLAFLQYTSGSTAMPKGVMVSHGNLLHNEEMLSIAWEHTEDSVFVSWLPFYHDMGLIGNVLQSLYVGASLILMSPMAFIQRPVRWLQAISRYKATTSVGPNFAYDLCVRKVSAEQKASLDLSSWNLAVNGSEPVRKATLEGFIEAFAPCGFRREAFYPGYGLAEGTLIVSGGFKGAPPVYYSVDTEALESDRIIESAPDPANSKEFVGCGHEWLGQQVIIVNPDTLVQCPEARVGEIWVSGLSVAQGYWNRPEETQQTFQAYLADSGEGPFLRTGDLGFWANGELFIAGRRKDLIIINGRNHYPQDIEVTVARQHPAIRPDSCIAFSVEVDSEERVVVAAEIERQYIRKLDSEELLQAIRRAVAEQHDLEVYEILLLKPGQTPKTSSGKLQRQTCRSSYLKESLSIIARWPRPHQADSPLQAAPGIDESRTVVGAKASSDPVPKSREAIEEWLIARLSEHLKIAPHALDIRQPFASYGLSSVQNVRLSGDLAEWLGRPLSPTITYEYPDIASLARYLAAQTSNAEAYLRFDGDRQADQSASSDPIAVIGMGCRFPEAENPEAFWQLLREGRDAISLCAQERRASSEPMETQPVQRNDRSGGFLRQVDQFDPRFFGISPREAAHMDPQQRLLLEVAWEALEDAGQSPAGLAGSRTGVFIGISSEDYAHLQFVNPDLANAAYAATGSASSIAANRLSYVLNLHGPSLAIDTACSSSLVAVHLACQSIRLGESRLALAGGVNLILTDRWSENLSGAGMLSPNGRCKTFDLAADGYVRAEGCGVVVLKRLSEAIRDQDNILAVIRGSAINQDGRSNGLTAPNGLAQQSVIRDALKAAGVLPSEIGYIEAHGSGTPLGDPIEINSLMQVLMEGRSAQQKGVIGSVKTNIGHLEAAAGIAGLIKLVLSLHHGEIPPHLHLQEMNPHISLQETPFSIPTRLQSWPAGAHRRLAGVSSFGFGGTNAHVVLEEAPSAPRARQPEAERPLHLLTLSARSSEALRNLARRYESLLADQPDASVADLCFTANAGRTHFAHRLAIIADSAAELRERLAAFLSGNDAPGIHAGKVERRTKPKIAFIVTGQSVDLSRTASRLYGTQPTFKEAIETCIRLLPEHTGQALRLRLHSAQPSQPARPHAESVAADHLMQFAVEYALAQLWRSWGLTPDTVTGLGIGECVAACINGSLSLEDGLRQVAYGAPARSMSLAAPSLSAGHGLIPLADESRLQNVEGQIAALRNAGIDVVLELGPGAARHGAVNGNLKSANESWLPWLGKDGDEWQVLLHSLGKLYVRGVDIDWERFDRDYKRRKMQLPTYPFERRRYWIGSSERMDVTEMPSETSKDLILAQLLPLVARLLQIDPGEIDTHAPFLEMGADSMVMANAVRTIENSFGIKISIRQLFEQFTTIDSLAVHLAAQASTSPMAVTASPAPAPPKAMAVIREAAPSTMLTAPSPVASSVNGNGAGSEAMLERLMRMQLEAFSQLTAQQLTAVRDNHAGEAPHTSSAQASEATLLPDLSKPVEPASSASIRKEFAEAQSKPYVPYRAVKPGTTGGLSARQSEHLAALIARYTGRTPGSKRLTQAYRHVLADSRAAVGFRLSIKEMLYPISGDRALGSKIWDVDGNEYIDLTMGFGVHLFGHGVPFIEQALQERIRTGTQLGPRSTIVGEVAELICELTGLERAAFCNSGTEAVMAAVRLARAATGRTKIALFAGSYHGHSDGTLAIAEARDGKHFSVPMAPGIPAQVADQVLVLDYGDPRSLDIIKANASELAAVLVEPVQSRRPDLQPREFLHDLRELTSAAGIVLIFDEMVTGFRIAAGGAQAWFGVQADLATYGKIIGGGMPIGVVAGKAAFMNGIDGGMWQYGDASYPQAETTFFGGTFCMNPLTMQAALAVLKHLKQTGPSLHQNLNRKTASLVQSLNDYFAANQFPTRLVHYGSIFRFSHSVNMDLFFYHLMEKGVYIWEWRSCFLSTAHTDEDVERVKQAIKDSLEAMREGDFLPGRQSRASGAATVAGHTDRERLSYTPSAQLPDQEIALTEAQKQLWLLAQMSEAGSLAYHETLAVEMKGPLQVEALRGAFQKVVQRHEALRTAISDKGDVQTIRAAVDIAVPLIDYSAPDFGDRQAALSRWLTDEGRRGLDINRAPLLRAHIVKLEEQHHVLTVTAHHIVIDGWSSGLLLQEIAMLYGAECGATPEQIEQPIQFREYLKLLDEPRHLQRMKENELYWLQKFAGPITAMELPSYRQRPPVITYRGARFVAEIDERLAHDLKRLGRQNGCTLFMVLLAGYTALLHRLTDQEAIVVGIPTTGRFFEGSERVVGYCTYLLPVQARAAGIQTVADHLVAIRGELLEAYEHEEYSFARLIRKLNLPRDLSRLPLVQSTFNLEPNPALPKMAGLELEYLSAPLSYSKFDLSVNIAEIDKRLRVEIDYSTDRFAEAAIARLASQFLRMLEGMRGSPEQRLSDLPLLAQAEQDQILFEWNDTTTGYPAGACVHEMVAAQAQRTPAAIVAVADDDQITYQELDRRANQLAHYLRKLGVGPEVRVGICVERSLDVLVGMLGVLKAGGAYIPLDPEYPAQRLAFMLEDAGASVLLAHAKFAGAFSHQVAQTVCLDTDSQAIACERSDSPSNITDADNLAYVIYTSGSTGKPKGVQISHKAFANFLYSMLDRPGLTAEDVLLAVTTCSFDIAGLELYLPLIVGAKLIIANRELVIDGAKLRDKLRESNVTVMQATPATWRLLLDAGWMGDERLKILCGGEALPLELASRLIDKSACLWNMYGPTETTIWSARDRVETASGYISIGTAIANTQIYLLDAARQPVAIGIPGELHIGGQGVARGYLNRPELTAEKFIPDPFAKEPGARLYKAGDLARHREDGRIELFGRLDHQVKLRGFRIELGEIEAALSQHQAVRETVVVVREDQPGDKRLIAYLVAEPQPSISELQALLIKSLPEYMVPAGFVSMNSLPRHPNGKINRNALPKPEGARPRLATAYEMPRTRIEQAIAQIWKAVLKTESVGLHDNFFERGGHSLLLAQVRARLAEAFNRNVPVVDLFRHPTIALLAKYLDDEPETAIATQKEKLPSVAHQPAREPQTEIAIIGMTGRFPGAGSVEEFWTNLRDAVESISRFSEEELLDAGVELETLRDPKYVRAGSILRDVELFDAQIFGISPREAEIMDPQHRLFLECAWEALENAGYDTQRDDRAIGVYAGVGINTYLLHNLSANRSLMNSVSPFQLFIANDKDFVPSRVSYKLNLHGPSVNVQTACSSSLVAVHLACKSLLSGECEMALAGGVAVKVPQKAGYYAQEQGIDSPDGHCRAFDAKAAGTVFGDGVGIVVLKRLSDAVADGDFIHAVIKGSAANNDGSLKVSYTAPSVDGQAEVIARALAAAQVEPETIGYIETHGTGTHLGDPIEFAALSRAFQTNGHQTARCALGSVKTNVGHLDTAAGVAGLIKTVLALEHKALPPSLHFDEPNPEIDFARSPFYVNTALRDWESSDGPRRAGVSSFGIGGTNVHVVLEEAPTVVASSESRPSQLLVLSAKTGAALESATSNLLDYLKRHTQVALADVAYTLQIGRREFEHRRIVVCKDHQDAIDLLTHPSAKRVFTQAQEAKARPVVFMFPGQGTQYVNMGLELYRTEATFREHIDACSQFLQPHLGLDLRELLYPDDQNLDYATEQLQQTYLTQPALFVVEYALARLWMNWGINPQAMIGHSIGEYVAACLAGVFSLEEGLGLVAARGRLMQSLPAGAMIAVPLPEQEVQPLLNGKVSLAAVNGSSLCIVSGGAQDVEQLIAELDRRGVVCNRLRTSHAFHSEMLEPILDAFASQVSQVRLQPPQIAYFSNLTGDWVTPSEAVDPEYWVKHLRHTVRFADGLGKLLDQPEAILLEVGPGQSLSTLARRHPKRTRHQAVLPSLRHAKAGDSDVTLLLTSLGHLWMAGAAIDWREFYAGERRRRLPLPTYPFERQSYWIAPEKRGREDLSSHTAAQKRSDVSTWFYLPFWKPSLLPRSAVQAPRAGWLAFIDDSHFASLTTAKLRARDGGTLITVRAGEQFARLSETEYLINTRQADDYRRLLEALQAAGGLPSNLLHLWNVAAHATAATFDDHQHRGFFSLIHLARAIGETGSTTPLKLMVVSSGVQSVSGEDVLDPEKATLLGPCRVIPQEYPYITCRSIDVALSEPEGDEKLVDLLVEEIISENADAMVAYRQACRWVQAYEPVRPEPDESRLQLKEGGVYLITGGPGNIGLALAEGLAQATRGKLVLLGRSAFPEKSDWPEWLKTHDAQNAISRKIQQINQIEKTGAELIVISADVTDREKMQLVIDSLYDQFGQINGVIHAAGVAAEKSLCLIQDSDKVISGWDAHPKLQGLIVLESLLGEREVDFILLMSSISSILGGQGYTYYAAGNLFMDAFAKKQSRNDAASRATWISINWDAWQFGRLPSGIGTQLDEIAITPPEGREALRLLLSLGTVSQVVISPVDLRARKDYGTESQASRQKAKPAGSSPLHQRPDLKTAYVAAETETEKAVVGIWKELLGIAHVGTRDTFFDLGGDSLLAVQLISRLRATFQVDADLQEFFELSTVQALAEAIDASRRQAVSLATEQMPAPARIASAPRDRRLPLSYAQQRLWVADQLEPDAATYNLPTATMIKGPLNVAVLEQTFNEILRRHEVLRAGFPSVDGQPIQVVAPTLTLDLPVIDIRRSSPDQRWATAVKLASEEAERRFDLARAPLLRATLLQTDDQAHVLLLTMHHLVSDGWSMGILIGEVAALYQAYATGHASALRDLPIQYADFALWQRQWLKGETLDSLAAYWKSQLGGNLPVLKLATSKPRPPAPSFRGVRRDFRLPKELSSHLKELSHQQDATLFMTLLAAFKLLLYRHTNQEDIVIGTDIANRNQMEIEGLIGFFVNQLVLRTHLGGNPTFRDLLARVKTMALRAYSHQDMPFDKLIELLKPPRDLSPTPLFQIKFVFQNTPAPPPALPGLSLSPLAFGHEPVRFDLTLFMWETDEGLAGTFEYNTDIFDEPITRLLDHFEILLKSIVSRPDARLTEYDLLTEDTTHGSFMEKRALVPPSLKSFKGVKPRPVTVDQRRLVKTDYLGAAGHLPLVIQPAVAELDLADWARGNRGFIETELLKHGALLFRGFDTESIPTFEQFAHAACTELFSENGEHPRESVSDRIYSPVFYPSDKQLLWHNENSFNHDWPTRILFCCLKPAQQGGETTIVDSRKVFELIDPKVRARFMEKNIMYVRNYDDDMGLNWQTVFQTLDKRRAEEYCRKAKMDFDWKERDRLRSRCVRPAVIRHPKTGEMAWFNQAQHWHISCLDPATRRSLQSLFADEDLPRNCYYGDGSPIEDAVMEAILDVYRKLEVSFPWQKGDILFLDNLLTAHGRNSFVGERKLLVAFGDMSSFSNII